MKNKTPIQNIVDKKLEEKYNTKDPTYTPAPNMRPSFLGAQCLRKIYYNFLRVKPDYGWTADKIKNFERGDYTALMVKQQLRDCGMIIDYKNEKGETPLHWKTKQPDPEFPVNDKDLSIKNAKIDGLGILKNVEGVEPGLWIFEIKSINEKGFQKYLIDGPKPEHKQQGMLYTFLLEKGLEEGSYKHIPELTGYLEVKGVIFIYVNRENDNDPWKEYVVPKNGEIFLNTIQKIVKTKDYIEKDTLPPKTEDRLCDYCEFRYSCVKDYKVPKVII